MQRLKVSLPSQTKLTPNEEALRIDVFWEEFKGSKIERVEDAMQAALADCKWFPTPAEMRELMNETFVRRPEAKQIEDKGRQPLTRERARELLNEVYARLNKEDAEAEKKRVKKFEQSRAGLLKQRELVVNQKEKTPEKEKKTA